MPNTTPKFVWYELMSSDCTAAASFYSSVIGWDAKDSGLTDCSYTIFSAGAAKIAGLMPIPEEVSAKGIPPCWTGYVLVDDVDAYAERVQTAGGTIRRAADDIPGVGRFAVVADPHSAVFILFKSACDQEGEPVAPGTSGHIGWHELHAGDGESAFAFYAGLFGWSKAEAIDMGPMGVYQLFSMGGEPAGGMMTKMPQTPQPFWLFYVNVDAIDDAVARVNQAGGQTINGPMQVPGGRWIAQCLDPQGAIFAMVAPER
jgi:predicted enzyme related to lactoylglutathione lyase